jgi:hypothetical protein
MLCHQFNEVNEVALAEKLARPRLIVELAGRHEARETDEPDADVRLEPLEAVAVAADLATRPGALADSLCSPRPQHCARGHAFKSARAARMAAVCVPDPVRLVQ